MVLAFMYAATGGYFHPAKLAGMLVLAIPWLFVAPWIHHDAKRILAPQGAWSAGIVAAGAVGLLIWMIVPFYLLGMVVYLVPVAAVVVAYLVYRKSHADESAQLTAADFFPFLFGSGPRDKVEVETRVKLYDAHTRIVLAPPEDGPTEDKQAYNNTQNLLFNLMYHRASEADVAPAGQQARVRMVVDGVVTEHEPLDLPTSESVIQYLKGPAGMDAEERRRPQQGHIAVDLGGKPTDVVLATTGTTGGQRLKLHIVEEVVQTSIAELGISEDIMARLELVNRARNGLLIVSAPPKNGVTSTLYSLLTAQDAYIKQLATLESKVIVDIENVTQHEYGDAANLPRELASAYRRDPDVLMVDQCPSTEVAELIHEISRNKLVLLGIRARDSFSGLAKWIKISGNTAPAVRILRGALCQVLLRKLCMDCREAYTPDPKMLAKANIGGQNVTQFYRKRPPIDPNAKDQPEPCQTCQESGYYGRTAAFEYLELTDEIREMVISGAGVRQIKAACRKNKMLNLQEQALKKVITGISSIKEVIRVTQETRKRT